MVANHHYFCPFYRIALLASQLSNYSSVSPLKPFKVSSSYLIPSVNHGSSYCTVSYYFTFKLRIRIALKNRRFTILFYRFKDKQLKRMIKLKENKEKKEWMFAVRKCKIKNRLVIQQISGSQDIEVRKGMRFLLKEMNKLE